MLSGKGASPDLPDGAGRHRARARCATRARCASSSRRRRATRSSTPARCRSSAASGARARRFDEIVTELPHHQRPLRHRQGRHAAAHRIQAQPRLLGARPGGAARAFQFRARGLPQLQRQTMSRSRPSRPASSTSYKEYRSRSWVRQHKGVKWDDERIVKASLDTGFGQQMQIYQHQPAPALFQDMRVREALVYTYDFEHAQQDRGLHARQQRVQQHASSRPQGVPSAGRAEAAGALPCRAAAARLRPGLRGAAHRQQPQGPARRTCSRRVRCSRRPAGSSARDGVLRNCQAASRSSSSTWCRARATSWTGSATCKKLGITTEGTRGRLRALPPPPAAVRLRHGGASSRALHAARRRPTRRRSTAASPSTSRATATSAA